MMNPLLAYFIVWNIGQGQFTTYVGPNHCLHFDAGGEFNVMNRVKKLCFNKMNYVYLSHWDMDHISWVGSFRKLLFKHCVVTPTQKPQKKFSRKLNSQIPTCSAEPLELKPKLIYAGSNLTRARPNDQSVVYQFQSFLIPGDSTVKQELIWGQKINHSKYLVLGHHGSQSSTSDLLLDRLPILQMAICSARRAKYGHPDGKVIQRLRRRKIPLLKTEDWGNIGLELKGEQGIEGSQKMSPRK